MEMQKFKVIYVFIESNPEIEFFIILFGKISVLKILKDYSKRFEFYE